MDQPVLSVALPPSARVADHARAAEAAGCTRLWLFDSPGVYGDIWIAAARVAGATSRPTVRASLIIGLVSGLCIQRAPRSNGTS